MYIFQIFLTKLKKKKPTRAFKHDWLVKTSNLISIIVMLIAITSATKTLTSRPPCPPGRKCAWAWWTWTRSSWGERRRCTGTSCGWSGSARPGCARSSSLGVSWWTSDRTRRGWRVSWGPRLSPGRSRIRLCLQEHGVWRVVKGRCGRDRGGGECVAVEDSIRWWKRSIRVRWVWTHFSW